jgi:hypothetical protein
MRKIVAFYAWQSDTPEPFNRHLIRIALEEAAKRITQDSLLNVQLNIDSDTEGVPGHAPITETILKKIDGCDIFIPDLSFVACTDGGKRIPNPNVMTEYGYALRAKTYTALVPIMNTAFGLPGQLPFDMAHLRYPIQYHIEPAAKDAERRTVRQALSMRIEKVLRAQIAATEPPRPAPPPFATAEPKDGPARFRAPGEALGIRDGAIFVAAGAGNKIYLTPGPAMWLRLMPPFYPGKKWKSFELRAALNQGINLPTLIGPADGTRTIRADDGVGTCITYSPEEQQTDYVAFVFESGEVWAISAYPLRTHRQDIVVGEIEKLLIDGLRRYTQFLTTLGMQPPYRWIAGVTDVMGREIQYPVAPRQIRIPGLGGSHKCVSEHIVGEGSYDGKQSPTKAILPFFNEIYNKCGIARPDYLVSVRKQYQA